MSELHVVLGASGGAGAAIVTALTDRGLATRGVSRHGLPTRPAGVEDLVADITDPVGAKTAVHGAGVVYMAAQPAYDRWSEEFPAMLETVIAAVASSGARLVMVDNCYDYGPVTGPMTESTPRRATDVKGRVRAAMVTRLLEAHATGEIRTSIGRASDYFGPGVTNSGIAALVFDPLGGSRGGLRWLGRTDVAHSAAFVPDIARALVTLGTDPRAEGRVWHLPHAPAVTGQAFMDLVNDALPAPRRTSRIAPWMVRAAAPFSATSRETVGVLHQWDRPFVVDDSAFRTTFGFDDTPLRDAIAATVAASRSHR